MKNLIVPGKFVSQMHPVARSHFQRWAEYMYDFPEAAIIMRYHDRSDKPGEAAIRETFAESSERVRLLYHILKDADALDRWRLGRYGLAPGLSAHRRGHSPDRFCPYTGGTNDPV